MPKPNKPIINRTKEDLNSLEELTTNQFFKKTASKFKKPSKKKTNYKDLSNIEKRIYRQRKVLELDFRKKFENTNKSFKARVSQKISDYMHELEKRIKDSKKLNNFKKAYKDSISQSLRTDISHELFESYKQYFKESNTKLTDFKEKDYLKVIDLTAQNIFYNNLEKQKNQKK